jgi:hypothetical protein
MTPSVNFTKYWTGRKRGPQSPAHRANISAALKGIKITRAKRRKCTFSPEGRAKVIANLVLAREAKRRAGLIKA